MPTISERQTFVSVCICQIYTSGGICIKGDMKISLPILSRSSSTLHPPLLPSPSPPSSSSLACICVVRVVTSCSLVHWVWYPHHLCWWRCTVCRLIQRVWRSNHVSSDGARTSTSASVGLDFKRNCVHCGTRCSIVFSRKVIVVCFNRLGLLPGRHRH